MPLSIGDLVVHPVFGIGHIVEIEEKQFSERGARLYYKITRLKNTMWVLVKDHETSELRLVTARADLDLYRHVLKSLPVPLIKDRQQRQRDLFGRLNQGSFQGVCEVLRDLTAWGRRGPLGQMETTLLQKTRESIYQEWALAAGVSTTEAMREVESLLVRDTAEPAFGPLIEPAGGQAKPYEQIIQ